MLKDREIAHAIEKNNSLGTLIIFDAARRGSIALSKSELLASFDRQQVLESIGLLCQAGLALFSDEQVIQLTELGGKLHEELVDLIKKETGSELLD